MKPTRRIGSRHRVPPFCYLTVTLAALSVTPLLAVDWNGSQDSSWNNPLNWNEDAVPNGIPAAIQSATGNISTITEDSTFAPSEIIIGGWWATGRLDHPSGILNTQNVGWPPGWVLVGFGAQGNATYNLADTSSTGGQFTGFGTGTGSTNLTSDLFIGEPGGGGNGNGIGTTNINTSSNLAVAGQIFAGVSGWTGHLNLDAGTVTATNLNVAATRGTSGNAAIGNFRMSGGTLALIDRLNIANGSNDVPLGNNVGIVTIRGGTLRTDDTHNDFWAAGVNMASGSWNAVTGSGIGGTGGSATLNLDGGTLSTLNLFSNSAVDNNGTEEDQTDDVIYNKGTSILNFNGGTLQAQGSRDVPWFTFIGGSNGSDPADPRQPYLTAANVMDGGAIIDSNGFNILVTQPLLHGNTEDPIDGGLVKRGAGQLEMAGQSTFTGPVVVEAGTLYANLGNAPNNRAFSHVSDITLNSGTTLRAAANALFGWDGSQAKPIFVDNGAFAVAVYSDQNVGLVTLAGGTLASEEINDSGWGSWNFGRASQRQLLVTADSTVSAVGVGLQNGASIDVEADATLDFTGTITNKPDGPSALTKWGLGTLVISGANTYTGATRIEEGTVVMHTATLSDSAPLYLEEQWDAVLNLAHELTDTVDSLYHNGVHMPAGLYRSSAGSGDGTILDGLDGPGKLYVTNGSAPVSGYAEWANTHVDGQSAGLDFDNDGVANGVEFFMNTPTGFTASPTVVNGSVTWPNGGNIPASAYGAQFHVETSTTLATGMWSIVPVENLTTNTDGPGGELTYTLPTGLPKLFVRLVVDPE
jgi:autotransporter-associated beta strand protein